LLKTIGEGSFAKVKLAVHKLTHIKVAIKVVEKGKILAGILDYVVSKERLAESEAKEFVKQIVSALVSMINQQQYVHGLYIAHRDLKAENILLDAQKNIKIAGKPSNDLDFGLSNCFEPHALLLTACGSPVYSAPEVIEGKSYSGPEADSWSLWINVYAMVVGNLPFADSNITALYEAILRGNYFVPDFVSQECRNFLTKVLDINPYKR
jgi:serine/threonine protein kinase